MRDGLTRTLGFITTFGASGPGAPRQHDVTVARRRRRDGSGAAGASNSRPSGPSPSAVLPPVPRSGHGATTQAFHPASFRPRRRHRTCRRWRHGQRVARGDGGAPAQARRRPRSHRGVGTGAWSAHRRRAGRRSRSGSAPARSKVGLMAGVAYDTGALIAAERNDRRRWRCTRRSSPKRSSLSFRHRCWPERGVVGLARRAWRG